jgi:hypothetical protein
MKKIIVTGFPHCGTTILRKMIGNHPSILDIERETKIIDGSEVRKAKTQGKSGVVIKEPFFFRLGKNIRQIQSKYTEYKFIMIIRNPTDIVSSMNMRFNNDIPGNHNLEKWQHYAQAYLSPKTEFAYHIKYEELFENDYAKLKELFVWLNLEWTDEIVNKQRITKHNRGVVMTKNAIPPRNHSDNFRTWQINQQIQPMINVNRDKLDEKNKEKIDKCEHAKTLGYTTTN